MGGGRPGLRTQGLDPELGPPRAATSMRLLSHSPFATAQSLAPGPGHVSLGSCRPLADEEGALTLRGAGELRGWLRPLPGQVCCARGKLHRRPGTDGGGVTEAQGEGAARANRGKWAGPQVSLSPSHVCPTEPGPSARGTAPLPACLRPSVRLQRGTQGLHTGTTRG